jgi:hypothetical protein
MKHTFQFIDSFICCWMGIDIVELPPGTARVLESSVQGRNEACWAVCLEDGRSIINLPPGTGCQVEAMMRGMTPARFYAPEVIEQLKLIIDNALAQNGLPACNCVFQDLIFACDETLLRWHRHGDCRQLVDASIPPAEGLELPTYCFPDGVVYGVVQDGRVISVAYVDKPHGKEGLVPVAYVVVETASAFRRRGYAQTVVSAVVDHVTSRGGEAWYDCVLDNAASAATALSVGYLPYGRSLCFASRPEK